MPRFVDLTHDFAEGMPGLTMTGPDGQKVTLGARIRPFVTHEQSRARYGGKAEFTMTEVSFQTSLGTYVDSPYVRWRERRDVEEHGPGVGPVEAGEAVEERRLPRAIGPDKRKRLTSFDFKIERFQCHHLFHTRSKWMEAVDK